MPLLPLPLRRIVALTLAAAAAGALAAEPGDATVRSYSGQPLVADIELTDLTAQDLTDLQARLARPDVFEGANVKMNPALAGAALSIVKRDQKRVLHVTTVAPVQGELVHLFFQLSAAGRDRTRSVTLWLSPDPNPPARLAVAPAPAAVAPAPVAAAAASSAKPAGVATSARDAAGERQMLSAAERSFAARAPRERKAPVAEAHGAAPETKKRPILTAEMLREAVAKYASTASDFKRGSTPSKPAAPVKEATEEAAAKPAARLQLTSREDLAEAARATKAAIEQSGKPAEPKKTLAEKTEVAKPVVAAVEKTGPAKPAAPKQDDAAVLNKLAELEGKLKTLQALVKEGGTTALAGAKPAALAVAKAATAAAPIGAAQAAEVAKPAAAAPTPTPAVAQAQPEASGKHETVAAKPEVVADKGETAAAKSEAHGEETEELAAAPTKEEAKPKQEPKAAVPPPAKEPEKEVKISRPKILTFLFAGFLVLLAIFGVMVHFIRKAKNKRSPIVRQSWTREDDDDAPRMEPVVDAAPAEEIQKAA